MGRIRYFELKVVLFIAISVTVVSVALRKSQSVEPKINLELGSSKKPCERSNKCLLTCSGGPLEETVQNVNDILSNATKCAAASDLTLEETTFTNDTIATGWLDRVNGNIRTLKMVSLYFTKTGTSLFSGKPFDTSLAVTLRDTTLTTLRKSMFTGSALSSFELTFSSLSKTLVVEEGALSETSTTLETVVIQYCLTDGTAVRNLTGSGPPLAGLQSLDLSHNYLPRIYAQSFARAPDLKQLFLISSGVSDIEADAFDGLNKLIQLHLSDNSLKTLPEGVGNDLVSLVSFYVSGNPWKCDCSLQWLRDYLEQFDRVEVHECRVGADWIEMDEVDFCPTSDQSPQPSSSTTTSTTSSTTTSTITSRTTTTTAHTTTEQEQVDDDKFVYETIYCRKPLAYEDTESKTIWYRSMFKKRNIQFAISQIGDDSPSFLLDLAGNLQTQDYLIWKNVHNESDQGCYFDIEHNRIALQLNYASLYTLCVSINDTAEPYALVAEDCSALATPPDWYHRPWLLYKHRTVTIASVLSAIVVIIIADFFIVYGLIRWRFRRLHRPQCGSYSPKSVKDNRHVSLCTDNDGYLTPKLTYWIKRSRLYDKRYEELETIKDGGNVGAETNVIETDEMNVYEPPPLPPPNRSDGRRESVKPYFYSNM